VRVVLASGSPGRLALLRRAGIEPTVLVPGVDEDAITAPSPVDLVAALARAKGEAALAEVGSRDDSVVIACDSMLLLNGQLQGKPKTPDAARELWRVMRGHRGELLTGHHVSVVKGGEVHTKERVARTVVQFAEVTDAEIDAYVATGEPLQVAGGFTIDGRGGAFIERIEGDHLNVVGLSLPLLRRMVTALRVSWPTLWSDAAP